MTTKKKPSARKTLTWVSKPLEHVAHELAEKKEQLAAAEELVKKGEATMFANAAAVMELNQALADSKEYAEDLRQKLVAEQRELEFWVEESHRFRDQVVALLRAQAVRHGVN
jgi:septal ring factor EnvC (AmiA/AmiB activator)